MPSTRRRFLAVTTTAGLVSVAGCTSFNQGRPDVNSATGLSEDTSQALAEEAVYLAGNEQELPPPPTTAASLADADVVLATAAAPTATLTDAFEAGLPVGVAGGDAQRTVRNLLERVQDSYSFGMETARGRPIGLVVAEPRGKTVETYTFIDDGGWDDPVLDPLGWSLVGRIPECATFVPESSRDDLFEYAGGAHVIGHLSSGETYATRSEATVSRQDRGLFIRLQTSVHAAANDGYAIEHAVRETDLPNDQHIDDLYPNSHTQNGVQIANHSDAIQSTFKIKVTPDSPRARSVLTGCGGLQTEGELAYDYRTSVRWHRKELLERDRHYAGVTGRGEWVFTE